MPFVELVDQPHWAVEPVGGFYVPKVHLLCIVKGISDPDLAICHEFAHYCDELKGNLLAQLAKGFEHDLGVQKRALRDLTEFRAVSQ